MMQKSETATLSYMLLSLAITRLLIIVYCSTHHIISNRPVKTICNCRIKSFIQLGISIPTLPKQSNNYSTVNNCRKHCIYIFFTFSHHKLLEPNQSVYFLNLRNHTQFPSYSIYYFIHTNT